MDGHGKERESGTGDFFFFGPFLVLFAMVFRQCGFWVVGAWEVRCFFFLLSSGWNGFELGLPMWEQCFIYTRRVITDFNYDE